MACELLNAKCELLNANCRMKNAKWEMRLANSNRPFAMLPIIELCVSFGGMAAKLK